MRRRGRALNFCYERGQKERAIGTQPERLESDVSDLVQKPPERSGGFFKRRISSGPELGGRKSRFEGGGRSEAKLNW